MSSLPRQTTKNRLSLVNIPLGNYAMATWVTLSGGNAWGINLEGVIYRTGYYSSIIPWNLN